MRVIIKNSLSILNLFFKKYLNKKESNQLRHSLFFVQIVITQAMCKTETKILFFEYDF